MHFLNCPLWLWLSVGCLLCLVSCREDIEPEIKPSEFNKALREQLGAEIKLAIAADRHTFPLLPDMPPYRTTVYQYVRTLYQQATSNMQLDRRSPDIDRWDQSRRWQVRILNTDQRHAFVIPGGDFYITTGFLRALTQEYQLYYIMAFEATLMQDRYLLQRMFEEFGTQRLYNIARGRSSARSLVPDLVGLKMDPSLVVQLDDKTAQVICETSSFDRRGILPLIELADEPNRWLELRPSYFDRAEKVTNWPEEEKGCGDFRTDGSYAERVLEWLP